MSLFLNLLWGFVLAWVLFFLGIVVGYTHGKEKMRKVDGPQLKAWFKRRTVINAACDLQSMFDRWIETGKVE